MVTIAMQKLNDGKRLDYNSLHWVHPTLRDLEGGLDWRGAGAWCRLVLTPQLPLGPKKGFGWFGKFNYCGRYCCSRRRYFCA